MKNVFENAKFGDKFQTRDGRKAIYYRKGEGGLHTLMYDNGEVYSIHSDGHYHNMECFVNTEEYILPIDIVGEWQEPFVEEELAENAEKYAEETPMDKYLSEEYVREIASHYDSIIFFAHSGDNNSSFIKGSSENLAAHFVEGITRQEGFLSLIIASLMIAREQNEDARNYIDACARAFLENSLPKKHEDIPYSEEEDED